MKIGNKISVNGRPHVVVSTSGLGVGELLEVKCLNKSGVYRRNARSSYISSNGVLNKVYVGNVL